MVVGGNEVSQREPYYLSDSLEETIDPSKTGNIENGKYIIHQSGLNRDLVIQEIILLSESELILKNVNPSNRAGSPAEVKYTAVRK
jgi:hypothetical protein